MPGKKPMWHFVRHPFLWVTGWTAPAHPTERPVDVSLPFLLVSFPMAVALVQLPWLVGMTFTAYLFLAHHFHCLRPFLLTLAVALGAALLVFTGATIHYDIDNYIGPQIRLLTLPVGLTARGDGWYSIAHCALPQGFAAYGAALYRLTGSMDLGTSAFVLFLVAAWRTLRPILSRLQTVLLLTAPAAMPGLFCLMPDGCLYYLLLIALFSLRARYFWLPLLASAIACTYKTSAWIPTALIMLVLFRNEPRRWWALGLVALGTAFIVWPTINLMSRGGLDTISSDFLALANTDAKAMGHLARLAYVHLGHWTTSLSPTFGTHIGGVDGLSSDAFGPVFRALTWSSLVLMLTCRKRLTGWWETLLVAWASVLLIPSLYVGYARYTPLLFLAGALPAILLVPRAVIPFHLTLLILPFGMLGWRLALSSEALMVANHATAVQCDYYNIRSAFRPLLTAQSQPNASGCLLYSYAMPEGVFPPMPRKVYPGIGKTPTPQKAREVVGYALHDWLPWVLCHPHTYLREIARFRWRAFMTFPRGAHDGLPDTESP